MKKLLCVAAISMVAFACKNAKNEQKASSVKMPMPVSYSSSFEIGKPEYCATIIQGSWKDWDDNTMDNMKSWVADTVVAYQSDNKMIRGVDSLQANWKRGRAKYTMIADTINAVTPLYSTDKKENWVLVWVSSISTDTTGKKDTSAIMETWRINKDGKADLLLQFDRANRKN